MTLLIAFALGVGTGVAGTLALGVACLWLVPTLGMGGDRSQEPGSSDDSPNLLSSL